MPKTVFRPEVHGFAFVNSWTFDPAETNKMNSALHDSVDGAVGSMGSSIASMGRNVIVSIIQQWFGDAKPVYYGLCGGMAFAALDYYKQGKPLPRGQGYHDHPTYDTSKGKVLREYLWRRQLESMAPNVPTLLSWMFMLHIGFPFGGAGWLLERAKEQWDILKQHIDQGNPIPICLIGSSKNPFHNHQVLAYGYDDHGDGTGVIYLYDMNCPDKENTTTLDFRGRHLEAVETCPTDDRGALRGFFCESYTQAIPPDIVS